MLTPPEHPLFTPQTARATFRAGGFVMEAEARATPLGLLAIGGMVAAILLSIPPIVHATRGQKRLPAPKEPGAKS
jgi:hypothetical protein